MTAQDLIAARKRLGGITQTQMAKLMNTPFSTYQKWDDGRTKNIPGCSVPALKWLEHEYKQATK